MARLVSKQEVEKKFPKSDEVDNDPDNGPDEWQVDPVDLIDLEEHFLKGRPIYTRDALSKLRDWRGRLLSREVTIQDKFLLNDIEGKPREILRLGEGMIKGIQFHGLGAVEVDYLTTVELHPDKQALESRSDALERLLRLNPDVNPKAKPPTVVSVPYTLKILRPNDLDPDRQREHLEPNGIEKYMTAFQDIQRKWRKGLGPDRNKEDNKHLNQELRVVDRIFQAKAEPTVPIRKIVCFGLGRLDSNEILGENDTANVDQYLMVFHIANILRELDPQQPPVQIIMQDPLYRDIDFRLIRILYNDHYDLQAQRTGIDSNHLSHLSFVNDPEGLLAIDENTLVVVPFVHRDFPFFQILADIVKPAAILADAISHELYDETGNPLREWKWENRGSPRVANMLKEYTCTNFDDVRIDKEYYNSFSAKMYWLWTMELWRRREPPASDLRHVSPVKDGGVWKSLDKEYLRKSTEDPVGTNVEILIHQMKEMDNDVKWAKSTLEMRKDQHKALTKNVESVNNGLAKAKKAFFAQQEEIRQLRETVQGCVKTIEELSAKLEAVSAVGIGPRGLQAPANLSVQSAGGQPGRKRSCTCYGCVCPLLAILLLLVLLFILTAC